MPQNVALFIKRVTDVVTSYTGMRSYWNKVNLQSNMAGNLVAYIQGKPCEDWN
jgi:hypothetical protein